MGLTMLRFSLVFCLVLGLLVTTLPSYGQGGMTRPGTFDFNDEGINFMTADSSSKVNLRFRIENQAVMTSRDEDITDIAATELGVRRARIRLGGYLFDPRLFYVFHISFARGDLELSDQGFPNIIRDAVAGWQFNPDLQVSFGLAKLPGNRQRVLSSADMQYIERSVVNSNFTLDRDFGVFANYRVWLGDIPIWLKGAVSSGDGRNQGKIAGDGIAYTGRIEVLPFGSFTKGGDYVEGDIFREQSPKLSVGFSANANNRGTRTRGTLGTTLYDQRSSTTLYADALFKYNGFAAYGEWAKRSCDNPITTSADGKSTAAVIVGSGYMAQASYILPFDLEFGARYATVTPEAIMSGQVGGLKETTVSGMAVYHIKGHRIKLLSEVMHDQQISLATNAEVNFWVIRLGMEIGI